MITNLSFVFHQVEQNYSFRVTLRGWKGLVCALLLLDSISKLHWEEDRVGLWHFFRMFSLSSKLSTRQRTRGKTNITLAVLLACSVEAQYQLANTLIGFPIRQWATFTRRKKFSQLLKNPNFATVSTETNSCQTIFQTTVKVQKKCIPCRRNGLSLSKKKKHKQHINLSVRKAFAEHQKKGRHCRGHFWLLRLTEMKRAGRASRAATKIWPCSAKI